MFAFHIELTRDDNGTFLVTCTDLPEVTTFGEDEGDALLRAQDAVEEAIAARIFARKSVPMNHAVDGFFGIQLSLSMSLKVILHNTMLDGGIRKAELARRIQAHGPQVDRLLNIRHSSHMDTMERAIRALGRKIELHVS
jgi:antitoxin HicB